MENSIADLEKKYKELVRKPNKSSLDILRQKELAYILEKSYDKETKLLIEDFNIAGINVNSLWELVDYKYKYPKAIPILINHLSIPYSEKSKEGIIRALAVKEATGLATPALLAEYNHLPKDQMNLRWAIGNTIYTTITEKDIDGILPIVQDKTNGISRQMFVLALGKVNSEKGENVLINLLNDDEVLPQAIESLGKMQSKKAKEEISSLLNHSNSLIRKVAKKALKKIK